MNRRSPRFSALASTVLAALGCGSGPPLQTSSAPRPQAPIPATTASSPTAAPPSPATSSNAPSWGELRKAARAAFTAHDYVAYRARLTDLFDRSGSSYLVYELARAELLLEHRDAALDRLRSFVAMGLSEDFGADPVLAKLVTDPAFSDIRARLASNRAPVSRASVAFALPHQDLLTEDVTYDAASQTFFVSSVRQKKIVALDKKGSARDFIAAGSNGVGSICGVAVADGRLWATTAELAPMLGYVATAAHPTAVLAFDLKTGTQIERVELDPAANPGAHALTDVAVGPAGDVFASDALGGNVYALDHGTHALRALAPAGVFVSPQTAAATPDGRLLVPDYVRGIAVVDLKTSAISWMPHPPDVAVNGIDGIYLDGTSLLAVQNGVTPVRVVRFTLDAARASIVHAEVLEQATPGLGEPTHGVVVDGSFFFLANAGWTRFGDDGAIVKDAPADAPSMMRIPLR